MSVRAAIVVGAVLVALLVTVVVVGVDDEGTASDTNAVLERLRGLVGDPATVGVEDIDAPCADDDDPTLLRFSPLDPCTIEVRTGRAIATVRLVAESSIEVFAPAPRGDVTVEADAAPGEEVVVAVSEGVTAIALRCPGLAATCEARLAG